MPIYEYRCPKCKRTAEILRPYEDMNYPIFCKCDGSVHEMELLMSRHNNFQWDEFVTQLRKDQAPVTAHRQTVAAGNFRNETAKKQATKRKIDTAKDRYMDQGWKSKTFYPGGGKSCA